MTYRTKLIDYSANNPQPKTDRFCVCCHRDIRPKSPARSVHLVDGGTFALHPEDESKYTSNSGDQGSFLIGPDCAKRLGIEWTMPA